MDACLRAATSEDAPTISRILAESWKAAYVGMVPQAYLDGLDADHSTKRVRADLSSGKLNAFLLLEDGIPVGTVGYGKSRDEKLPDWGEIQFIYLCPGFCRRGYGKKLLCAAVDALQQFGFQNCFLWVLKENRNAQEFYSAVGFRATNDITHSKTMGKQLTEVRYCFSVE